jgi:hypothetical protein
VLACNCLQVFTALCCISASAHKCIDTYFIVLGVLRPVFCMRDAKSTVMFANQMGVLAVLVLVGFALCDSAINPLKP